MTYGIDLVGSEIRWVRRGLAGDESTSGKMICGRIPLGGEVTPALIKRELASFFSRERVRRFVFPVHGSNVRVKCFASDKVDISELEDNVAWEARFYLEYDKTRDVLSFAPLRSVGSETWIVAAAAPAEEVSRQAALFPAPAAHVETALTALANAVLESKWGQSAVMLLHLDSNRAFFVIVSHGNPVLMQEIPCAGARRLILDDAGVSLWQDELKLRRNFLPQDNRKLDYFLLSGEAALEARNARVLGELMELEGSVFSPFGDERPEGEIDSLPLYTLAYACALREEQ